MKEPDFLDQVVEERSAIDPDFAALWSVAELRLELVRIRKRSRLTQGQLAQKMGVPQPRIAEIERDPTRVSFGRILAYLRAAGASLTIAKAVPGDGIRGRASA